ncbi:hypothetical protein CAEBREN_26087 [Caenorhabditis brenneri]|uniref:BTB domain-containing protein n=1 Tax=Caenorhabditis brenneri TaxID=135651 RepID=G0NKC7_CAEBE|nr:hypothetical protein CAEBREN_26087 [Caenorhabditis brenneri]
MSWKIPKKIVARRIGTTGAEEFNVEWEFLSYHSEFFRRLFNSKSKESKDEEHEIKEVTYLNFGLVMSCIYPDNQFPDDRNCATFLELGRRFLMQSALNHVEHHLLHNKEYIIELRLGLADEYNLDKLLDQVVSDMDSLEKVKKLSASKVISSHFQNFFVTLLLHHLFCLE